MPLIHIIRSFLDNPLDLPKNIVWRFPKTKSTQKHIFVIGAPRSGTTLIKSILCAHPNLKGITCETTGIFRYKNIFNLNGYNNIFNSENFDSQKMSNVLEKSKDIVTLFDNFCSDYLAENRGIRFIEKINTPTLNRMDLLINYFPNSQFIHIFRDGRDCYCSALHHPHVYQTKTLHSFARHWQNCINSRLKYGDHPNIYDLSYEALTSESETEKVIRELINFLGEEYHPNLLDPQYYANNLLSKATHHQKLSQPIRKTSQGRWKKELTSSEINQFQAIAGQQLEKLGYDLYH